MAGEPTILDDTSADAERILIDGYRKMSPARKLERVFDLSETLRQLSRQRIVERHGAALSKRDIHLRLAALYLDRETMIAAFGYDPDTEGSLTCNRYRHRLKQEHEAKYKDIPF